MRAICFCLALVAFTPTDASPQELPRYSTPQNMPCSDQPTSIEQLVTAFNHGNKPKPTQVKGTWVAIGFLDDSPSFNCTGVTRGGKVFEWIMLFDHDSIEIDMIGTYLQSVKRTLHNEQSLTFSVDVGADGGPEDYRCRLTTRGTLACLSGRADWLRGVEFKMMTVTDGQRASRIP